MVDLVQAQNDLTSILGGSEQFATTNVFSFRRKLIASELDYVTMLAQPKAGKAGSMAMVLMPTGLPP